MSEPGRESIPTSADPRSQRPTKRRAVTPRSEHASQVDTLFKDPSKEVALPGIGNKRSANSLAPPPEIVANVQGSSAGAGSGEFHVYKASRRREYERLRLMQSEVDKDQGDKDWEKEREDTKRKDDEKTEKNRRRREKKKAARGNKKGPEEAKAPGTVTEVGGKGGMKGPRAPGQQQGQDGTTDGQPQYEEVPGVIIHDED
ncbi:hypothetical protein N7481_004160 [Penicillium waksmanii]|uniref:uncharacterized protein n=1 Tax=Penicillium waksmanii TaxID=69791 RepID=UPI0025493CE3|nr:uncharacterized protein N7481_004160 [Penicillium waksmanii]KAJ5988950.1 hypothetical protein N7481_004160 [Penicillium waksmanii]